ncbi:hypothetical protein [Neisseria sicca]|uniref:hypothetical protein n=1 Tax=Neisseria sicca TaxID=490 RepID=UPI003610BC3A
MRNYPNKQALLDAVQTALDKYLAEFADWRDDLLPFLNKLGVFGQSFCKTGDR